MSASTHEAALTKLEAAARDGTTIRFGSMGTGLLPTPGHSCAFGSRGLAELNDTGGASIYSFNDPMTPRLTVLENETARFLTIALSCGTSLLCFLHLWLRRPRSWVRKLFWSVVVWLPFLGPLFYVTLYRIPPKTPDSEIPQSGHQY